MEVQLIHHFFCLVNLCLSCKSAYIAAGLKENNNNNNLKKPLKPGTSAFTAQIIVYEQPLTERTTTRLRHECKQVLFPLTSWLS